MAEKQCSSSGCTKESCEGCPSKNKPTSFQVASNEYTKVKHVIGVVSGKGGVGKSMVTASLANLMAEKGYRVGILDADITGPSIPKMYGLHGPAQADDNGIYPPLAENDIKVMSINLLMPDEEAPVIWRGPVISGMVKQFWTDVIWGELDYLFVDMPPGTGDVPLTVFQSLPLDGIVIVSSPQDLVQMIVKKAYHMAKSMNVPILGIVENYIIHLKQTFFLCWFLACIFSANAVISAITTSILKSSFCINLFLLYIKCVSFIRRSKNSRTSRSDFLIPSPRIREITA